MQWLNKGKKKMKLSKAKVKKEYGIWYYHRIKAELDSEGYPIGDLDADIYEIYNENQNHVADVGVFSQVREYCMAEDKEEYLRIYG